METAVKKDVLRPDCYVVEIDGKIRSAYGIFVEALKAGLELKQKFPHSPNQGPRSRSWSHRVLIDSQSGRMALILLMP
jgi:hypothetical protein